jgi:hypothetical protein
VLDEAQTVRKHGALTVLALLFSVLLGSGPLAAGTPDLDARSSRLGQSDVAKGGAALRAASRTQAEEPDSDPAVLPPHPGVRTDLVATRAAGEGQTRYAPAAASAGRLPYQARAPPAA